jgi:hypothetical protein
MRYSCCGLQHVTAAYEHLQPVITALLQAYSQHLKQDWFTLDAFLWVISCTTACTARHAVSTHKCSGLWRRSDMLVPMQAVQFWNSYSMQVTERARA